MLSECIYKVLMESGVVTSSDACDLSVAIEAAVLEWLYAAPVVQPGMAKLREHVAWCMKGSASLVEKAFNEVPGQGEVSLQVALGEKLKWWMRTAELIAAAEGKG